MMIQIMRDLKRVHLLVLPLAAALVFAGCEENRTTLLEPVGPPAINFGMQPAAANLPSGQVFTTGNGGIFVILTNLRALSGGATYQFWLAGFDDAGNLVETAASGTVIESFLSIVKAADGSDSLDPLTGDPVLAGDEDTVATNASSWTGSDQPINPLTGASAGTRSGILILDQSGTGDNPDVFNSFFVTIEQGGAATTPSEARILWGRFGSSLASSNLNFGTFGGPGVFGLEEDDYVYTVSGGGLGGFRGGEISIDFQELPRPPVGFFYRAWLVDEAGNGTLVDTLASSFSPNESESRVSLFNADVDDLLPGVAITSLGGDFGEGTGGISGIIRTANIRACATADVPNCDPTLTPAGLESPFGAFRTVRLVLEPKGAPDTMGNSLVLEGEVPDEITEEAA